VIYWDLRGADEHPALALGEAPAGLLSAPEQVFLRRLAEQAQTEQPSAG